MLQDNRDQQQASTSTVCKKSSSCSRYNSTFQTENDWIVFYILFGTAVIPGKKAAQDMQMLVYTNFIELSYGHQVTPTQLAVCTGEANEWLHKSMLA